MPCLSSRRIVQHDRVFTIRASGDQRQLAARELFHRAQVGAGASLEGGTMNFVQMPRSPNLSSALRSTLCLWFWVITAKPIAEA